MVAPIAAIDEYAIAFYTSRALLDELANVLPRRKLAKAVKGTGKTPAQLIAEYEAFVNLVAPGSIRRTVLADPDDDHVLCARPFTGGNGVHAGALYRAMDHAHAPEPWRWRGRPVRLVDGTTVVMPDTAANQALYAQPRSQKPGLGFPLCRMVGMVCLGGGAVLNAAVGQYQGKGSDEQSLLRSILDTLERGDLLVGDAFYATYFLLCALRERGIDAVFEQHGSRQRTTDFRRGQRLGTRDHLIVLQKPAIRPGWMSQTDYEQAPASLTVRNCAPGAKLW